MKTLSTVIAGLILAGGTVGTVAVADHHGDRKQLPPFSTVDLDGSGSISREEAAASGISDRKFDKLDKDGDGEVSQQEYEDAKRKGHERKDRKQDDSGY